ncbi:MAG: hypothetical protein O7B24_05425 [Alphaproteobacteria bacterium]|nr:hypothetical protein [Alphaproteobacteria bacterium]
MTGSFERQPPQTQRGGWLVLLLGLLVTVLIHVPSVVSVNLLTGGGLFDSDAYMRLLRVVDLHAHGRWYDAQSLRTNAPFGETLHWTRPLDTILLAGALLGSAVTDFRDALEVWGKYISPVMLLLVVVVWRYGTRGVLSNRGFMISIALLPLLPLFDLAFAVGRPDHHSLLNLLFVGGLVMMFRIVTETTSPRLALAAGALSGFAIWISVEAMAATAYFAAALTLFWVWRGHPYLSRTVLFVVGLFAAITIALLIERPPSDWSMPVYKTISVVHWFLAAVGMASWVCIAAVAKKIGGDGGVGRRFAAALAGALIPALAVALVFPRFYFGPLADFDAAVLSQLYSEITESQPLLPITRERAFLIVDQLGPVFFAVLYVLYRLRRGDRTERQLMALLLLGFVCFVPLAFAVVRWSVYAQALAWLPWTLAALALLDAEPRLTIAGRRIALRMPAVAIFLTAPALLALAITPAPPSHAAAGGVRCDWPQMAAYLSQRHATENGNEQLLFTDLIPGPALVWTTPYNVVGAPYGNAQSLNDTFGFFGAGDDVIPREIVSRRNVDLVLVCRGSEERRYHDKPGIDSMFARLSDGAAPAWLEPVRLPDHLSSAFRLYRVPR